MPEIQPSPPEVLEQMALALENSGNFKILRRFVPRNKFHSIPPKSNLKRLMVLDTETTGLDYEKDKAIEIGYVIATYDADSGKIYEITDRYNGLQDPGFPLSDEIKQVTGITDEDLAGQSFDAAKISSDLATVDVIIAHNAPFDRNFIEKEFPLAKDCWWACSQREAPWAEMNIASSKQEYLAYKVAGIFYEAHRASTDAEVLVHLLTCFGPDNQPILASILESSRNTSYRVWATNSPFETKDHLKKQGFRWNDGSDPKLPIKAWFKDSQTLDDVLEDLAAHVYPGSAKVTVDTLSGFERYTERYETRDIKTIAGKAAPLAAQESAPPQKPKFK